MPCIKCKKEIQQDFVYCPWCGKKQTGTPRPKAAKKENGSGTVFRRGKKWACRVRQIKNGVVVLDRTKYGFETKAEAAEYVYTLKAQQDAPPVVLVRECWERHQKTRQWTDISAEKRSHYMTAYKWLAPIAEYDVAALRFAQMQEIIDNVGGGKYDADEGYYPKKDVKTVLLKILAQAVKEEYISPQKHDLMKLLELPPNKRLTQRDARTAEEMLAIWNEWDANRTPIAGYALIMAYTGMRTGELFAQDVAAVDVAGRVIVGGIKTEAGRGRQIPIADKIVPVVEAALRSAKYGLVAYDENRFYDEWSNLIDKTGIRKLDIYCQRHTCKTRLEELVPAVSKSVINSIMGHSNKNEVDNAYTHISLESKLEAINRLV